MFLQQHVGKHFTLMMINFIYIFRWYSTKGFLPKTTPYMRAAVCGFDFQTSLRMLLLLKDIKDLMILFKILSYVRPHLFYHPYTAYFLILHVSKISRFEDLSTPAHNTYSRMKRTEWMFEQCCAQRTNTCRPTKPKSFVMKRGRYMWMCQYRHRFRALFIAMLSQRGVLNNLMDGRWFVFIST